MQENGLIRKIRLISKSMTSQLGKAIAIQIFTNISRSKDDQTVKQFTKIFKKVRAPFNGWDLYK